MVSCCPAYMGRIADQHPSLCCILQRNMLDATSHASLSCCSLYAWLHMVCACSSWDGAHAGAAALGHQHPKVKELALQWLVDSVKGRETKATIPKLAPALLPAIAKCAEDAVPGIREGGFTLMVSFAVKVRSRAYDCATATGHHLRRRTARNLFVVLVLLQMLHMST